MNLVLIKRAEESAAGEDEKGSIINVPMPSTVIYKNDILMVVGSDDDMARLPQE